jgi:hypothetical protein
MVKSTKKEEILKVKNKILETDSDNPYHDEDSNNFN